jgi:hypothetical protein
MKKNIIFLAIFIIGIFLCVGAVSAATTGSNVTVQKKISNATSHQTVGNTIWRTEQIYFTKNGHKYWYRYTTHYISSINVYTNYATSWGTGGYLQYVKSSTSSHIWYKKAYGNFWQKGTTGTTRLSSNYNSYTALNWLSKLNYYNRYTLKQWFQGTSTTSLKLFATDSKKVYDSYYNNYITYTWKAYKTNDNYVKISLNNGNPTSTSTTLYTKTGTTLKKVTQENNNGHITTFSPTYVTTSLTAVQYYYKYFKAGLS